MKPTVIIACFAGPALLMLAGCSRPVSGESASARPPVAVETVRLEPGEISVTVDAVGSLEPKFSADVKSEYSGTVTEVLVTEWVHVRKGTPLARLDSREAQAGLLQVQAETARADREYERAVKLKQAGLLTQQEMESAQTLRDTARAQLDMAETRMAKTLIRSPMDGVVALRNVSTGDYVENMGAAPMFKIVDNRVFDLAFTVPSTRIHLVAKGQPLTFTTEAVPGKTFSGTVSFINPAADPGSRTVKVQAEVPNGDGVLRAGYFAKGVIRCGTRKDVLLVPREALLSWDVQAGKGEVYVVEDGVAHRRAIGTADATEDAVVATEGLKAGDLVVVRGGFTLQDGDRVTAGNQE